MGSLVKEQAAHQHPCKPKQLLPGQWVDLLARLARQRQYEPWQAKTPIRDRTGSYRAAGGVFSGRGAGKAEPCWLETEEEAARSLERDFSGEAKVKEEST